jgi:hypothetical protein
MIRDIIVVAGSHQREVMPYIRPETQGLALDSLIAAFVFEGFRARGDKSPLAFIFSREGVRTMTRRT